MEIMSPIFADPLAALLALKPDLIEKVRPVRYTFNHSEDLKEVHLLDKKAGELVLREEVADSTVFEVVSLKSKDSIQKELENELLSLYPKRSAKIVAHEIRSASSIFKENEVTKGSPVHFMNGIPGISFSKFFAVSKFKQKDLNVGQVKALIRNKLELKNDTQFLQVIGDSS